MTFSEIYNAVIAARFKSSQTTSAKRWINLREAQIWAAAEWPWKIIGPTQVTVDTAVVAGVPGECQSPLALYDDNGDRVSYMTQQDFDDLYVPGQLQGTTGRPSAFKWNNRVLTVGDTPDQSYVFQLTFLSKLSHYDVSGAAVVGPMSVDSDTPMFGDEWGEILVLGAVSTGLKLENDPTWESLESEFAAMLTMMVDHYLPAVAVAGNMQYGADWL